MVIRLQRKATYQFTSDSLMRRGELHTAADTDDGAVCLLDDDLSVLKATSRLLSSSGRKVESFMDPIAFLCYAQRHRPEVAVIDISMPVVNGLQVQAHLRNLSPTTGALPFGQL
jgi:FixJ family two-component response regulator